MSAFIKRFENNNKPIVDESSQHMSIAYFNLIKLETGETY